MNACLGSPSCPFCGASVRQSKNGKTVCGSQKYRCSACQKTYNPTPKKQGYPEQTRQSALKMYVGGLGFRRIARLLEVNHQTVVNWVNAHHAALLAQQETASCALPAAEGVDVIEMDELFTFVGHKKTSSTL